MRLMVWLGLVGLLTGGRLLAADADITPRVCLVLGAVGRGGMSPIRTDAVEKMLVTGTWQRPNAGDMVTLSGGKTQTWTALDADKDGVFRSRALAGGYAFVAVTLAAPQVMILEASSHGMVYVNGEPRVGDVYGANWSRLPVWLHAGENELLFAGGRSGELRVKLLPAPSPAFLNPRDLTVPDFVVGAREKLLGGVIVVNATNAPMAGLAIRVHRPGVQDTVTPVPSLPPLCTRKVAFSLVGRSPKVPGEVPVALTLEKAGRALDAAKLSLRVRRPTETYKVTFMSAIDGSVQYYAVNPPPKNLPNPALFLTLHGASVEAIGQADAYGGKAWGVLVAPTNRRPYGFDWEDWGRLDALEVLELARARFRPDPRRVFLTGHSMGGHGTWQLGALFPDKWAAIGPSAGWVSFFSYAGVPRPENPSPLEAFLLRSRLPSDTLAFEKNYASEGVYIIHGDADDNVPVAEARTMRDHLAAFHHDFVFHEQPGAGHWWDNSDDPGADCVDWFPLFDFFGRHQLPADASVRQIDFVTPDPGVSSRFHWAEIRSQTRRLLPSSVHLRFDPGKASVVGTTENVARLALDVPAARLELDGQTLAVKGKRVSLARGTDGKWAASSELAPTMQTPARCGPFKAAFNHRMLFVYGTRGTAAENTWALAKARFDAEQFWYRGNGSVDMVADTEFDAKRERDRSVIVYGSADTNAAWKTLLADSPVQVKRGSVTVGARTQTGDDLACLFVRPRPGSAVASVGVVSGTGLTGMRLTDRQPYLNPGVEYPDCLILGADMLTVGVDGVRAAGFFGPNWAVETGEWIWKP